MSSSKPENRLKVWPKKAHRVRGSLASLRYSDIMRLRGEKKGTRSKLRIALRATILAAAVAQNGYVFWPKGCPEEERTVECKNTDR